MQYVDLRVAAGVSVNPAPVHPGPTVTVLFFAQFCSIPCFQAESVGAVQRNWGAWLNQVGPGRVSAPGVDRGLLLHLQGN